MKFISKQVSKLFIHSDMCILHIYIIYIYIQKQISTRRNRPICHLNEKGIIKVSVYVIYVLFDL